MITNFKNSDEYRKKIHNLIPGGAHTYSKGDDQFPLLSPAAISYGKGGYLFDIDDNKFLADYNLIRNGNIHMVLRLCGGMFNEVSGRNGAYEPLGENFFDISDY